MPTIEIIALGCDTVPELPTFSTFGFLAEKKLLSHRGLFQNVFDKSQGIIVHLVNKGYEEDAHQGGLFAGDLIEWDQDAYITIPEIEPVLGDDQWHREDQENGLHFLPSVIPELKHLISFLLERSPVNQIYFSTDYQFGPREAIQKTGYTLSSFFEEHDESNLRFNTLYHIFKE